MEDFVLKDRLRHWAYAFPETMLIYEMKGKAPNLTADILCMDGNPVPYEAETTNDGYRLKVMADLPYRGEHTFTWKKGKNTFKALGDDNGKIGIKFDEGGLFILSLSSGEKFLYALKTQCNLLSRKNYVSGGALESVFTCALYFEGGKVYEIKIKLKKGSDFVEVYEEMSGFEENEAELHISWQGFEPMHRFTPERGEEKLDAYVDDQKKFPFSVCPFMPKTSWWDVRCAAYEDKHRGLWSGILLHDLKNFDDGQYAIWGSRQTLSFVLYEDKIKGRIASGKRAFMHIFCKDRSVTALRSHYLRYFSIVSLNKVKDYVLEWEDDKNSYPKYFCVQRNTKWGGFYKSHVGKPSAADMMNILDRDATLFTTLEEIAPVSCRAFRSSWAQTFDLTASELTDEEFSRVRAAMALVCYTLSDENYYPTDTILAGHPNFLTDVAGTVAVFASLLGANHPMHQKWLKYYEIALARNFKYHIRPDVPDWDALGGRWTENIGAYMMCMLQCIVYDCRMVYDLNGGEMPALYPHIKRFISFLINMQTAEDADGRRLYAPHGAHACTGSYGGKFGHGFMTAMIELADMLKNYEPLYAEYLLHNFRNEADFKGVLESSGIYGEMYKHRTTNTFGTSPDLFSCKYTGMGFMLRDHVNEDGEMCLILQQIDEGPNYRWGRAAQGGCGEIYYYADRYKYTDHGPEDVGDENRGDVQSCTNFGVLIGHEYRSVGRNDLSEPLMDFGFVKYARVNAGAYSYPYYKYRSVMMVENRYIAIYDAVGDAKQHCRFTWSQSSGGEFPVIKNLRPGVEAFVTGEGVPVDSGAGYNSKYPPRKIMNFNGQGDFLTVVTHLRNYHDERLIYSIDKKDYGAELIFPQTREEVFNDQARIYVDEKEFSFDGYVGYLTDTHLQKRLAIFNGSYIRLDDFSLTIPFDREIRYGMSAVLSENEVRGNAVFGAEGEVFVCVSRLDKAKVFVDHKAVDFSYKKGAYCFIMPRGKHSYNIGETPDIEKAAVRFTVARKDGFDVKWEHLLGAQTYEISLSADDEYTYRTVGTVQAKEGENSFAVNDLKKGKFYVRVRGINGKKFGEFSHAYPVYVTDALPHSPEGFRVEKTAQGDYCASWGEVLGCGVYKLYKVEDGETRLFYEGGDRKISVPQGMYYVTSVNGNGESMPSLSRSTWDERAAWDNRPEKGFVRDTRSHEHGYSGFDYINNKLKPILRYPEKENLDV